MYKENNGKEPTVQDFKDKVAVVTGAASGILSLIHISEPTRPY